MVILAIETSCDETGVAILEKGKNGKLKILSNRVVSSLPIHSGTGGIIPENAAREQVKFIIPVLEEVLEEFGKDPKNSIDAIAVTVGPGLIGSLLVGVETAKTLSILWNKPIIPVNHLLGHIYANFIDYPSIEFPAIGLVVSGGHTDLLLIKKHGDIEWLGGTRDDAAGEAFDKIGRLLNLPYPGGPSIEKEAIKGNPKRFNFPKPLINSGDFDFSFSGLKTAVYREVKAMKQFNKETISDLCSSVQESVVDVLVGKTLKAVQEYNVKSILLGGGVAANNKLKERFQSSIINNQSSMKFFVPEKFLCTDNAAMIASAAFYNSKPTAWQKIVANPELYFY